MTEQQRKSSKCCKEKNRVRKTCYKMNFDTICIWEKTVLELTWSATDESRHKQAGMSQKAYKVSKLKTSINQIVPRELEFPFLGEWILARAAVPRKPQH